MEINDQNLAQLSEVLKQTLNPDATERKKAETHLNQCESLQGFSLMLLTCVERDSMDLTVRSSASITFKNMVKRCWESDEKINEQDRNQVKMHIVKLMLNTPENIQRQLSEAISIIGKIDFYQKWEQLLPEIVSHIAEGDFNKINGCLRTVHSIFKRYRYEIKSNELWTEIKYVLDNFAKPLTDLFTKALQTAGEQANNPEALKVVYQSLGLMAKVFYSLNYQDLPEFFEDNMKVWMDGFHSLLTAPNIPCLDSGSDDVGGPQEVLKAQICENVSMYAIKYGEEFHPHLASFVAAVWQLLTSTGLQCKYDLLVSTALGFLGSVAEQTGNNSLFSDGNALKTICEQVILPNVGYRQEDEELFEDNPEEWIRRDLEGSDQATRRRASCDLIRSLSRNFEQQITEIFGQHINSALNSYNTNKSDWKSKEAAVFLVASLGTKKKTERHGVTETSEILPVVQFWDEHISQDMADAAPPIMAATIKFLALFRLIIGADRLTQALPALAQLLTHKSAVVAGYAAFAIEKILMTRDPKTKQPLVDSKRVEPVQDQLLLQLGQIVNQSENELAARALSRLLALQKELLAPKLPEVINMLTLRLKQLCANPARPNFNHNLFECIALSIRILCKAHPSAAASFEESLMPTFGEILEKDIGELVPYVFQIMALLLQVQNGCPATYVNMYPQLLLPVLWEASGNVQPLVLLLSTFIEKNPQESAKKTEPLLGVFQKLIASRSNDVHGFALLKAMTCFISPKEMAQYWQSVFLVLFKRLQTAKTAKYCGAFVEYLACFAAKHGTEQLRDITNKIQPNMFSMICEKVITQHIRKVRAASDRKMAGVFAADILTKGQINPSLWGNLLEEVIALFELPIEEGDNEFQEGVCEGYSNATATLTFGGRVSVNPLKENCPDPKYNLVQTLATLNKANPGQIEPIISKLEPEVQTHLKSYFTAANVSL